MNDNERRALEGKVWFDRQLYVFYRIGLILLTLAALVLMWDAVRTAEGAPSQAPSAATPTSPQSRASVWLTRGSQGQQVRQVQEYLADHGWVLAIDGQYGPVTQGIVRRVQAASGLTADGVVGPVTWGAFGLDQAVRTGNVTQTATPTPPAPSGPPSIIPGDCESVRRVFDYFDPSGQSSAFFIDGGIAYRESRCGLDTLNERTGDTGVVQLNPVHNRAGYFGGRLFGSGGWLMELHGLQTRQDTLNPEWANAAITLRKVCGNGPWRPPYSCANRSL